MLRAMCMNGFPLVIRSCNEVASHANNNITDMLFYICAITSISTFLSISSIKQFNRIIQLETRLGQK
jgi:hypothetical protein